MSSSRATSILTIAGIAAAGLVAYAVYFDYKRRTDVDFRKQLRKEKKRIDKTIASSKSSLASTPGAISQDDLRQALEQMKREEVPISPEQKEAYFMSQVSNGEQLSLQGPRCHLPAAMSFYRALRVYPTPVELMMIYQKTVPEPIFKLVVEMTNLDVKERVEGYYDHFPPKTLGVVVETRKATTTGTTRKALVLTKDVKAGEVIYEESPVVTALDFDIQAAGTHCSHCMRLLEPSVSIKNTGDALDSTYCSKACQLAHRTQSQALLFTLERPLPAEIPTEPITPAVLEERRKVQTQYVDYLKKNGKHGPLLVARFIARQIAAEMGKLVPIMPSGKQEDDFIDADGGDYLLADHLDRLRYLEIIPNPGELALITAVLSSVLPGLEQFVTDERYATLVGKMAYNAFGVSYGGGRDDKPAPDARPEDVEKTRTPYGTSRQIGSAFYTVSSYLSHSCIPNTRPSFSNGTSKLHLIANSDLKAGDELSVAYVDVTQHEGESVAECRRRRRMELARGWRFACGCDRCNQEGEGLAADEQNLSDESKVEETMSRYEENEGVTL